MTGGTSGIGRATAIVAAREGARVTIVGRNESAGEQVVAEIEAAGGAARFHRADLSDPVQIHAMVDAVVDAEGRLDWAMNNAAGETGVGKPTHAFDIAEFDSTVNLNLRGVWLCMKYEIERMLAQEPSGGAIVNTSSVNGLGGAPFGSLYSATKAGVLALTKSASQEYASQGIRVNALVPGAFKTPMLDHAMDLQTGGDPEKRAAVEERYLGFVPMRRIGDPAEAAESVVWMCSPQASYVTGHTMIVDGGMTAFAR